MNTNTNNLTPTNPAPDLAPQLKQLRLSGILDSLEARNRQAIESKLAYTEFLALLIQDEVARREQRKLAENPEALSNDERCLSATGRAPRRPANRPWG